MLSSPISAYMEDTRNMTYRNFDANPKEHSKAVYGKLAAAQNSILYLPDVDKTAYINSYFENK